MSEPLDCLVLGYDDDTPRLFARLAEAPPDSVESRIFQRNHLSIRGTPATYMDVINHVVGQRPEWIARGEAPFYHVGEVTNLAALYLSSYLLARGFSAKPISLVAAERDLVIDILEEERPAAVAITTTFYEDTAAVAGLARLVRDHCPAATVVVGGPLVQNLFHDLEPEAFQAALVEMAADVYVNEPEGEHTLLELLRAIRADSDLGTVPNVFVRDGDRFRFTVARREQNVLDECAIEWSRFGDPVLGRTVQTRTARSCAYHCSFCDYPIRAGRLSTASVAVVERELETLRDRGVENVVFVDDTFNVPHERFREICRMMIRRGFGFRWFSYLRCGSVKSPDTFDLMRESGCEGVFLGIESGDPTVLRNMDKASTPEQYLRGIEALHRNDILTFASFICGFPGETERSLRNTIDFLSAARPTLYRVEPWWYNHRSPIHRRAAEFGLTGQAYQWRHATMSAAEASDGIDFIFANVAASWWCPQQSFSFWALPYLMGKGMSRGDLVEFLRLLHARLPRSTGSAPPPAGLDDEALTALAARLRLDEPRFVRPQVAML
jgi:p-methyltransferase